MPLLRSSTLLVALVALNASTCRGKNDDTKPAATPEVSLPEVDTSALTPRERREWAGQVSELLAPCPDVPVNIAQCVQEKRPCKTCLPAAQFLLKQVQAGKPKKDREDAFHGRFDQSKLRTIVTDGSPEKGAPDAVVTIIEWADFECPFCKLVYPLLESLLERFSGQVRVVFKFYPLDVHPHGEIAARAGVAAQNQGKFWEMHHVMFDNQEHLEPPDLERYAKQLGLDVAKFRLDMMSKETTDRITKDKKQGEEVGLEGTPMIFVNGREVDLKTLPNVYDDLEAWVKLDIELAGKTPKSAPPKGSSMPIASAPAGTPRTPEAPVPAESQSARPGPATSAVPSATPHTAPPPRPPG